MLGVYLINMYGFSLVALMTFHCQHTFNPAYVVNNEDWNTRNGGLLGSSFIQIPKYLKYFFHGIEYHHIHHINSKIPGYNLQKYHEEVVSKSSVFDNIVKLSMMDCYNNLWLVLYDETKNKYITMNEADEEINRIKNN
jgi:omega-6 fatty acid desaturase (delta-12 desaturase)